MTGCDLKQFPEMEERGQLLLGFRGGMMNGPKSGREKRADCQTVKVVKSKPLLLLLNDWRRQSANDRDIKRINFI